MGESWQDRWKMIEVRWKLCVRQSLRSHASSPVQPDPTEVLECKGSIEALAGDLWALRDWLINDPTSPLTEQQVNDFLDRAEQGHIRACSDLTTRLKHYSVNDPKKHLLELVPVSSHGGAVRFRAVRTFQAGPMAKGALRTATGDTDEYEDALEMIRRAIASWNDFLLSSGVVANPIDIGGPSSAVKYSRLV